jgi:hypothetical protein
MSSALAPDHNLGAAADRTFILTTFVSAHSRKLVRPLAGLMQRRKAQPLDDAIVADRLGGEPANQCFNLVCHRESAPCLTAMANLRAARKHALPNASVADQPSMPKMSAADCHYEVPPLPSKKRGPTCADPVEVWERMPKRRLPYGLASKTLQGKEQLMRLESRSIVPENSKMWRFLS